MAEAVPSVEEIRQRFYNDLKDQDTDEVKAKTKKMTVNLYQRRKSPESPWIYCFYSNNNESYEFSDRYSASIKNLTDDEIADLISNCAGITDEELNRCKAAVRREIHSRNLPDLSLQPKKLQKLFSEIRKKLYKNLKEQKRLAEQINENMMNFKNSLNDNLEALKPLREITVTSDTTIDAVTTNIAKMRSMMQDLKTNANLAIQNLCEAMEKIGRYQEIGEKMHYQIFRFISHFFNNLLIPRAVRMRSNPSE